MMTLEQIKAALSDRKLREVSTRTGLSYGTIYKMSKGEGNPTYDVLKKVSDYLEAK